MGELRAEGDVVLEGGGAVRADRRSARVPAELVPLRIANGLTPQPLGAIVTRSGNLPAHHPYYDSTTVIYITSNYEVPVREPTVEVCHVQDVDEAVSDLQRRGVSRILSEGGPTLNA